MALSPAFVTHFALIAFGLAVGSFLNVVIWRIPREESIVTPPSHCPSCGATLKPWDNIPLVSWIALGGRCRYCRARISPRYPMVEALNALLWEAMYARFGMGAPLLFYLALSSAMIVVIFVDIDHQIIPEEISVGGLPIALLMGALVLPDPFARAQALGFWGTVIGAAAGFSLYNAIAVAKPGGMGGGDIKLMALAGAVTGWKGVLLTTFAGSLFGSVYGLYIMVRKGAGPKTEVPFGPFLVMGILLCLFRGEELFRWYWHAG